MNIWLIQEVQDFVNRAYYPDLVMVGKAYAHEASVLNDIGVNNLYTFKEFQIGRDEWLLKVVLSKMEI